MADIKVEGFKVRFYPSHELGGRVISERTLMYPKSSDALSVGQSDLCELVTEPAEPPLGSRGFIG